MRTVDGVTTVDSGTLRDGLNSILAWLHDDSATLDSLINTISPKDASGNPIYTDTKSFEDQFICGPKLPNNNYATGSDSLVFVSDFLNYMLALDNQLPTGERPNGSILFDFNRRFTSPLDSSKEASSDYLQIVDSNSLIPSTVRPNTTQIGGGKSDPNKVAGTAQQQNAPLPAAAKSEQAQAGNAANAARAAGAADAARAEPQTHVEHASGDESAEPAPTVEPNATATDEATTQAPAADPAPAAEPTPDAQPNTTATANEA